MGESQLIKDFKGRDVQRMRNIITKDYSAKTSTQIGYTKSQADYQEGDVWEDSGKVWTIKNGLKQTITRFDELKRLIVMPLCCPKCKAPMQDIRLNRLMYSIHQICFDCVIKHETKLKLTGEYEQYERDMINQGVAVHIKEMEGVLLELLMDQHDESFITEAGDIETWKGKGIDINRTTQEIQEYIQKLKDAIKV